MHYSVTEHYLAKLKIRTYDLGCTFRAHLNIFTRAKVVAIFVITPGTFMKFATHRIFSLYRYLFMNSLSKCLSSVFNCGCFCHTLPCSRYSIILIVPPVTGITVTGGASILSKAPRYFWIWRGKTLLANVNKYQWRIGTVLIHPSTTLNASVGS